MNIIQLNFDETRGHWHGYIISDPQTKSQHTVFTCTGDTVASVMVKLNSAAHAKSLKIDAVWGNEGKPISDELATKCTYEIEVISVDEKLWVYRLLIDGRPFSTRSTRF